MVEFGDGAFVWEAQRLEPGAWPFAFSAAPPMFVANLGPDAVAGAGSAGTFAYLDAGEAMFLGPGAGGVVTPLFDGAVATGVRITFVSGTGPTSFVPGRTLRDVNLVRAVVAPGEVFSVASPFAVLVFVESGVMVDAVTGTPVPVGAATVVGPGFQLMAEGDPDVDAGDAGAGVGAVVLAAVVGTAVT
jgi:hypothetical protein